MSGFMNPNINKTSDEKNIDSTLRPLTLDEYVPDNKAWKPM